MSKEYSYSGELSIKGLINKNFINKIDIDKKNSLVSNDIITLWNNHISINASNIYITPLKFAKMLLKINKILKKYNCKISPDTIEVLSISGYSYLDFCENDIIEYKQPEYIVTHIIKEENNKICSSKVIT